MTKRDLEIQVIEYVRQRLLALTQLEDRGVAYRAYELGRFANAFETAMEDPK